MTLVVKDRVKETTTTTGTGAVTLGGAATGFQSFSVIGDGNTTHYAIVDSAAGDFEIGLGTYTASGTLLSRDTVFESSNSGSAVSFSAGSKDVFVTYPAEKSVIGGMGYVENAATITQDSTINAGNNAMSAGPVTIAGGVTVTVPSGSRWVVV
tara:strand:- start:3144 stop:3602 length:459 start_codon:yes stop_codon:yes gene_type:complete